MRKNGYRVLAGIILFLASQLALADQGYLEKDGIRMPIKDTVVLYDSKQSTLSIYLFPSRLSAQDRQAIASGTDSFSIMWNKPSPDTKKWQWYPYGMIRLNGKNGNVNDLNDISGYYVLAYGISKKNFTDNINGYFSGSNRPALYKKRGSRVELKYQSMHEGLGLKWNLDIRAQ